MPGVEEPYGEKICFLQISNQGIAQMYFPFFNDWTNHLSQLKGAPRLLCCQCCCLFLLFWKMPSTLAPCPWGPPIAVTVISKLAPASSFLSSFDHNKCLWWNQHFRHKGYWWLLTVETGWRHKRKRGAFQGGWARAQAWNPRWRIDYSTECFPFIQDE